MTAALSRYAWLSIAAALATITLKVAAWITTDSVGLFSDALESLVNLVSATVALWALRLAVLPADAEHAHGHSKVEYFSSAFEGLMIFAAALAIINAALPRLMAPQPLQAFGLGLFLSGLASLINLGAGIIILRAGRQFRSITLEADAQHLLTDVWTSVGVFAGIVLVWISGYLWLDPLIALGVALNILWTGWRLLQRSWQGLMDVSMATADLRQIEALLNNFASRGVQTHALRTRQAGMQAFISLHVLVPGAWSVQSGHDVCEEIEQTLRLHYPHAHVLTHLEPLEDPAAQNDAALTS